MMTAGELLQRLSDKTGTAASDAGAAVLVSLIPVSAASDVRACGGAFDDQNGMLSSLCLARSGG